MKGDNVIVVLSPFNLLSSCQPFCLIHVKKHFKNCVRSSIDSFGSFTFRIPLNWLMVSIFWSIHKLRKRMYSSMMVAEF